MLQAFSNVSQAYAPSTWRIWIDYIMKKKSSYGIKSAALIRAADGTTVAATSGFILPSQEVQMMQKCFYGSDIQPTICLKGKSYVIKSRDDNHMIAFNGSKYYIIGRSKRMYLVVLCTSKVKSEEAAKLVRTLTAKLVDKNF